LWLLLLVLSPILFFAQNYPLFYITLWFSSIILILLYNVDKGIRLKIFYKLYNVSNSQVHIAKTTILTLMLYVQVFCCEIAFCLKNHVFPLKDLYVFTINYSLLVTGLILIGFFKKTLIKVLVLILIILCLYTTLNVTVSNVIVVIMNLFNFILIKYFIRNERSYQF
jgi:hypothetical protein